MRGGWVLAAAALVSACSSDNTTGPTGAPPPVPTDLTSTSLNGVIDIVTGVLGCGITRRDDDTAPGDPQRTEADATVAAERLGWKPRTSLEGGIRAQIEHQSRGREKTRS